MAEQLNQKKDMLLSTMRQTGQHRGLTHAEQQHVAEAAVPHLRVGNFDEALDKGKRDAYHARKIAYPF